ncbi:MAG: hypothetical protein HQK91_11535 [Nitrospirae bacterium]|nr:hypothetical protein [Nitrospirota bacterium]
MEDKKIINSCGCSENFITDETNLSESIRKLTDCPQCGMRLASPTELFNHVVMYHSS